MEEMLSWDREPDGLEAPVLVASFSGWNDAASSASTALRVIAGSCETEVLARVDPEELFDFQAARPTVSVSGGKIRGLEWPSNVVVTASPHGGGRDLVLLPGTEPGGRWRTFTSMLLEIVERCGIEMVVTFGSLIADVAHTRPVPVTGVASSDELVAKLGFEEVAYEGPTGITGVLHAACLEREIPSVGLWAAVPHYAAAVPNPKASLALLQRLEELVGLEFDAEELSSATEAFERQVSAAVEANPEIKELVEQLESQQDEIAERPRDVPSGDALAREFQRFLRQRGEG